MFIYISKEPVPPLHGEVSVKSTVPPVQEEKAPIMDEVDQIMKEMEEFQIEEDVPVLKDPNYDLPQLVPDSPDQVRSKPLTNAVKYVNFASFWTLVYPKGSYVITSGR